MTPSPQGKPRAARKLHPTRVNEVVVLSTAMLSFISFWRAGAIVLCDLASTAYYIGGISEQAVGKAAPWFILGVMLFSYTIRAVYMESCSMFVRGGVYKVVKEAMGGTLAKLSVSALIFDYILTGPISAVSAGQYLAGLLNTVFPYLRIGWVVPAASFSVLFAIAGTLYFWHENIKGIPESSDKALKIMQLTTIMGVVMIAWCGYTLAVRGGHLPPFSLSFTTESLGWTTRFSWLRPVGAVGIIIAFGHSLLAMSGEESLAQVYRELEAPKILNLERAGFLIFVYSLLLTSLVSFFAVMIIPDGVRLSQYGDNLLSGLAMYQAGPHALRVAFQAFVVFVGVLILMGAVNTSIVGAQGVLNRLAEDGVLLDYFRGLHPRFGTTHRTINMVVALQVFTILACRGDVYLLGEAYAFGVVWSFVFKTLAVFILRFKDRSPREFMVPANIEVGGVEFPVGLSLIFLALLATASMNLLTKRVATMSGLTFTAVLFGIFHYSEKLTHARQEAHHGQHEKLNTRYETELGPAFAKLSKPNRVVVAARDPGNLVHLRRLLEEVDEEKTDVIVMVSKVATGLQLSGEPTAMGPEEERLFTNVISVAEKLGKTVIPVLLVSNDPAYAVAQTAHALRAQQVVMGRSAKMDPDIQIERFVMTWASLQDTTEASTKVRILWDDPATRKPQFREAEV